MFRIAALILFLLLLSAPVSAQIQPVVERPSPTTAVVLQNAATANGNGTVFDASGYSHVVLTLNCTVTCGGTTSVAFEGSANNSNWVDLPGTQAGTVSPITALATPTNTVQTWNVPLYGLRYIRARIFQYSSGTLTVTAFASMAAPIETQSALTNDQLRASAVPVSDSILASLRTGFGSISISENWLLPAGGRDVSTNEYWPLPLSDGGTKVAVSASALPLPTGAATSAAQTTGNASLSNISAATDVQGGGFAATRLMMVGAVNNGNGVVTPLPLLATDPVSGVGLVVRNIPSGTQAVSGTVAATQSGTWTMQPGNTANTTPWLVSVSQGGNTMAVNASGQASVNCANCSGSGVSHQDNAGFTAGTTNMVPIGGIFDDTGSATATENSAAVFRMTQNKGLHVNFRNASGTEIGTAAAPVRIDPTGSTTQPVSGTVTANAGTGTFAISAAALPLPAGASTLAEQQTQTTALQLIDNLPVAQASATSGQSGVLSQGAVTTAAPSYTNAQTSPLSLTTAGLLRVDGSGATQPVSGTVTVGTFPDNEPINVAQMNGVAVSMGNGASGTGVQRVTIASDSTGTVAATQSGTWNVNNISGTVSLPTGAATSANQTTEITALQIIDNLPNTLGSTTAGQSGALALGAVTTAAPSYTNAQSNALSLTTAGALRVDASGTTQPISGTVTVGTFPDNEPINVAQMNGVAVTMGNGASGTGVQRVTIASDSTGQVALAAGSATIGALTAHQTVDQTRLNGQALASPDANSYQITANAATATSGAAASACNILSAASTNSTNCKASAGNIFGYEIFNTTTTIYYLRLYNLAAAPTCSSATGFIRSIPIPPAASAGQVGGAINNQIVGVNFSAGIGYCITAGSSSTDNTNAATGVFGEIRFK